MHQTFYAKGCCGDIYYVTATGLHVLDPGTLSHVYSRSECGTDKRYLAPCVSHCWCLDGMHF